MMEVSNILIVSIVMMFTLIMVTDYITYAAYVTVIFLKKALIGLRGYLG